MNFTGANANPSTGIKKQTLGASRPLIVFQHGWPVRRPFHRHAVVQVLFSLVRA